jgi:transposase
VSLIASLSLQGTRPALALEGAATAFLVFIRELPVPTLRTGDIVLMDNLRCHKTDAVHLAIEAVGAQVLFLSPYSPDFSPIAQAFSKLKAGLRRLRPQSFPDLLTALIQSLDSISVNDALGFFCSAGFLHIA